MADNLELFPLFARFKPWKLTKHRECHRVDRGNEFYTSISVYLCFSSSLSMSLSLFLIVFRFFRLSLFSSLSLFVSHSFRLSLSLSLSLSSLILCLSPFLFRLKLAEVEQRRPLYQGCDRRHACGASGFSTLRVSRLAKEMLSLSWGMAAVGLFVSQDRLEFLVWLFYGAPIRWRRQNDDDYRRQLATGGYLLIHSTKLRTPFHQHTNDIII